MSVWATNVQLNKNAFQQDAYRPRVDRMPNIKNPPPQIFFGGVWSQGEGLVPGGCLVLGGVWCQGVLVPGGLLLAGGLPQCMLGYPPCEQNS